MIKKYKGTHGLWRLLTDTDSPSEGLYTEDDFKNYSRILLHTNSIYKNNDPTTKKPKSSKGDKYMNLVADIWHNRKNLEGSGIRKYNENKIEYRYVDNLNKLYNTMNYIYAQEKAGHNNFVNEKKAIKDFISNKLDELIDKPEGIKYLMRILPSLSTQIMNDEKTGSGLLNTIINNLPFELHAPGYNFLGPGTNLEKRLARGDVGINPLDEAAREHDIWCRDHPKTKDRWISDKVLQQKAWDRVTSLDADVGERALALATTGGMWLKRKLGMGIDIEPGLKF